VRLDPTDQAQSVPGKLALGSLDHRVAGVVIFTVTTRIDAESAVAFGGAIDG
jgi:hypothetical protein